jgi:hypothetical protein
MPVAITLIDKQGNEWVAGSAIEVNDLMAQGYRIKGHADGALEPQTPPTTNEGSSQ